MKKQLIEKFATLITAAFGLIAALAWNDTIKTLFENFIGPSNTLKAMLIYAVLVTILAVIVTYWISQIAHKVK